MGVMVTVRYWAGARAAAGCGEEQVSAATVGDLIATLGARRDLQRILAVSSLLVDGTAASPDDGARTLSAGAVIDVLPPFAGG